MIAEEQVRAKVAVRSRQSIKIIIRSQTPEQHERLYRAQPEIQDHTTLIETLFQPLIDANKTRNRITLSQIGYSYGCLATSLSSPILRHHTSGQEIRGRRILISYPLGVLFAITLFHSTYFLGGLEERVRMESSVCDDTGGEEERGAVDSSIVEEAVENKGNDLLIIYGDKDQFTSVGKMREWSNRLEEVGSRTVKTVEIEGDHFWREDVGREELMTALFDWLE